MRKYFLLAVLFAICSISFAQTKSNAKSDSTKKAIIEIHLTNSKKQALKKEEIIIVATARKKNYRAITDAKGFATISVESGDNYIIKLKTIGDTTTYGNIEIDPLSGNQFYKTPFIIDMVYEPAKQYTFHHLEFDIAKATLKNNSYKELDQLVEFMQRKTSVTIEITGHTDNVGNDDSNKKLSQERADAVKNYLIQKGINTARMKTFGFGSLQPIADNSTEEGRQKNRRTELKIL